MLTRCSDRGAYDIRQSAANLAPPMYFERYLNQDWVQNAIGGTLNGIISKRIPSRDPREEKEERQERNGRHKANTSKSS